MPAVEYNTIIQTCLITYTTTVKTAGIFIFEKRPVNRTYVAFLSDTYTLLVS